MAMFFKLIKKDLKNKKSMNIIIFLFVIMTTTLIASSSNMIYTALNALDNFFEVSKVGDFLSIIYDNDTNNERMNGWLNQSDLVESFSKDKSLYLYNGDIILPDNYDESELSSTLILTAAPKEGNLIFNQDNKVIELNEGEVAIPAFIKQKLDIPIGEKIRIAVDGVEKEFIVVAYCKDAILGSSMSGMKRIVLNEEDYSMYESVADTRKIEIYNISKNENISDEEFLKEFTKQDISNIASFSSTTINSTYIMDIMVAGLMMLVSVFLILIALLIMRFTIVFTLESEYREIGVMKAIGLRNKHIKKLYLVKYLFLFTTGGMIGILISVPVKNIMLETLSSNIVIKESNLSYVINLISVAAIIGILVLFCNLCTNKINKFSAIDAIRNGSDGKTFKKLSRVRLHTKKRMKVSSFLAVSDLTNGFKRFAILAFTFLIGTILILFPINMINTLQSDSLVELFGLPDADVFIDMPDTGDFISKGESIELVKRLEDMQEKYKEVGVDVTLRAELMAASNAYIDDKENSFSIYVTKGISTDINRYHFLEGEAPVLENEVAISSKLAKEKNIAIGDTIHSNVGGKDYSFIITATYQTMNNLGQTMKVSSNFNFDDVECNSMILNGDFKNSVGYEENKENMMKALPTFKYSTASEFTSTMLGNIVDELGMVKIVILSIVMGINILITTLVVRMLYSKEIGQIAILKSIGFKTRQIKMWQVLRIGIVLVISVIIGTLLSKPITEIMSSGIFYFAGATKVRTQINVYEVYIIYPLVILVLTILTVTLSIRQIGKIKVWEINNQE